MSDFVAFIPARGNSKSVPGKNTKLLGGKPLISWTIQTAKDANLGLYKIVVNSEDQKIQEIASSHGVYTQVRDPKLSQDSTSMFEVLRSEIFKLSPVPKYVLLLQPTSPFRNKNIIQIAISYFLANVEKYDSLISVEKVPERYSPYAMIVESGPDKRVLFRRLVGVKEKISARFTGNKYVGPNLEGYPISQRMTRRQDLSQCWLPTGDIYLFSSENIKKGSIYGEKPTLLLETEGSININTPDDFKTAEQLCEPK